MESIDTPNSQEKSNQRETIQTLENTLDMFGDLIRDAEQGEYINLLESNVEEVKKFLDALQESGKFVFHSNPTKEILPELKPNEAVDNKTTENSMNAVFASPRYLEALAYGVLHKFNLSKVWKGFTTNVGYQEAEGVSIKLEQAVFETLQENKDEYLQNILLYVLDKSGFQDVPNREGSEYYSTDLTSPLLTLYVPQEVAYRQHTIKTFF